ncbi:hypothetical protein ACFQY0_00430 [Haloferula chungangensis]|uniref:Uncharacterized protein n=1 Tax=Haloferula chungangensis TaxID=1048331 RepID=A0ABW2L324_9BACT
MSSIHRRKLTSILLHALAAGIGIASALFIKAQPEHHDRHAEKPRTPTRDSSQETSESIELVDALIANFKAQSAAHSSRPLFNSHKRFEEHLNELEPSSDPQATFQALLGEIDQLGLRQKDKLTEKDLDALAHLAVRFTHWLNADPHAAIKALPALGSGTAGMMAAHFIMSILEEATQKQGLQKTMEWIVDLSPPHLAVQHLSIYLGKQGDIEELRWYLTEHADFPVPEWAESLQAAIASRWPIEERDALISELSGDGKLRALMTLAERMDGSEGLEWIQTMMANGLIDANELQSLTEGNQLREFIRELDSPLDERIELMKEFGYAPEKITPSFKAYQIVRPEVNQALYGPDAKDWLYWFRSGEMSAQEVYDGVLEEIPDLGTGIDAFRNQMFRHLAEDDLERAMELVTGGPEVQNMMRASAANWHFHSVDPNEFYALTSSITDIDNPKIQKQLSNGWKNKASGNLERYGESYLQWVAALPEGPNRIWALEGLEHASRNKHPEINSQVTTLLNEAP